MAEIVIVSTPGAEDANCYLTLAEAEDYFYIRAPQAVNWEDATDAAKSRALITATRLLDTLIEWRGETTSEDQALIWPRSGLYDARGFEIPDDEIPAEIQWAVCEFAEELLVTDRTDDITTDGIKAIDVGTISIEFMEGRPPRRRVLPDVVWELVQRWGTRKDQGSPVARLVRG